MNKISRNPMTFLSLFPLLAGVLAVPAAFCSDTSGTSSASLAASVKAASPGSIPEYVIGVEDVLAIDVWREPELSRVVAVRPDGKITLPLAGDLTATGKTGQELRDEIKGQLLKFIEKPEVTVIVQEAKSQTFNIIGEVTRPGSYPLAKPMTVLDALAVAGGLSNFAKPNKMYILRNTSGSRQIIPFHYKRVIKGKDSNQNPPLEARDTIVVP